jgi:hypothetical protein
MAPNPSHHSSSGKVGVITYDTSNGVTSLKKHVNNHHPQELKKWIVDEEANKNLEGVGQACKKRTCPFSIAIFLVLQNLNIRMTLLNKHSWKN